MRSFHEHDRKILDLAGLNEGKCFNNSSERSGSAGHYDKRVRISNQQRFADEKVMHGDTAIPENVVLDVTLSGVKN